MDIPLVNFGLMMDKAWLQGEITLMTYLRILTISQMINKDCP